MSENNTVANRNYGKLSFSNDMVLKNPDKVAEAFNYIGFAATKCEFMAHTKSFEYYGSSKMFRQVGPNEVIPEYRLTIKAEDGEVSTVSIEEKMSDVGQIATSLNTKRLFERIFTDYNVSDVEDLYKVEKRIIKMSGVKNATFSLICRAIGEMANAGFSVDISVGAIGKMLSKRNEIELADDGGWLNLVFIHSMFGGVWSNACAVLIIHIKAHNFLFN